MLMFIDESKCVGSKYSYSSVPLCLVTCDFYMTECSHEFWCFIVGPWFRVTRRLAFVCSGQMTGWIQGPSCCRRSAMLIRMIPWTRCITVSSTLRVSRPWWVYTCILGVCIIPNNLTSSYDEESFLVCTYTVSSYVRVSLLCLGVILGYCVQYPPTVMLLAVIS